MGSADRGSKTGSGDRARPAGLGALTGAAALLLVASLGWRASRPVDLDGPRRGAASLPLLRIDVNAAAPEELAMLPGIGPTIADRIVAERERGGPFGSARELARVEGVGPVRVAEVAPYVEVEP